MYFYKKKQIFLLKGKFCDMYRTMTQVLWYTQIQKIVYIVPALVLRLIFLGIHTYSTLIAIHLRLYFCLKQNLDMFSHRPFVWELISVYVSLHPYLPYVGSDWLSR